MSKSYIYITCLVHFYIIPTTFPYHVHNMSTALLYHFQSMYIHVMCMYIPCL